MVDYATSHYDLMDSIGGTTQTLDVFKHMTAVLDNDVIAESREDTIIAGTELNASSLGKNRNTYTTVPLKPFSKDINFLYENYIHQQFTLKFSVHLSEALTDDVTCAVYLPMSTCLPSRYQLLLGNSPIWENTYQRLEAVAGIASLPQEVVQTNPEVATMSKLLNQEAIPGVYITLTAAGGQDQEFEVLLDCNIDLDDFTPILSNLPYTTNFMGNLRLRLFYENIDHALCVTPIPVNKGSLGEKFHVLERLPFNKQFSIGNSDIEFTMTDWYAFSSGVEIIQANFSVKPESIESMKAYIGQDNKLLIPTQVWAVSNSGQAPPARTGGNEFVFQINAYNIHTLAFMFQYAGDWETYFPQPKFTNIDIKMNGKSINYIPYANIGPRVYKDTAQAFLNDDKWGINENLVDSIMIAGYNGRNNGQYSVDKWNEIYSEGAWVQTIRQPNNFLIAKGLSPPNCFERGYCTFASNPQSTQIRFTYSLDSQEFTDTGLAPPSYAQSDVNPWCLALQDCCLLLSYNPYTQTCQSGTVEYAQPYVI